MPWPWPTAKSGSACLKQKKVFEATRRRYMRHGAGCRIDGRAGRRPNRRWRQKLKCVSVGAGTCSASQSLPTAFKKSRFIKKSRFPQERTILNESTLRGSGRPAWPQNGTGHRPRCHSVATQASQSHGACLTTKFVEYRPRLW